MKAVMLLRSIVLAIFSIHITSLATAHPLHRRVSSEAELTDGGESEGTPPPRTSAGGRPIPALLAGADENLAINRISFQNLQDPDGFNHWVMLGFTATTKVVKFDMALASSLIGSNPARQAGHLKVVLQDFQGADNHRAVQLVGGKPLTVEAKVLKKITVQDVQSLLTDIASDHTQLSNYDYTQVSFTLPGQQKRNGMSGCKVWVKRVLEELEKSKLVTATTSTTEFDQVFFNNVKQAFQMGGGIFVPALGSPTPGSPVSLESCSDSGKRDLNGRTLPACNKKAPVAGAKAPVQPVAKQVAKKPTKP
jgi:hypothetical protein